jgi:Skp family chaperone for outer membrane proteins
MKGLLYAGGVAVVLGALLFAGRSWSEPQKPAAPRSRIAVVNMGYVLKNYKKVEAYTAEMKETYKKFDDTMKAKKNEIEARNKLVKDPESTPEQKEAALKEIIKIQQEMEDLNNELKKSFNERNEKEMVVVYGDIRLAAERHAKAHDLELVVTYIDAVNEADRDSPRNVIDKMMARPCFPLYVGPGLDISADITDALNNAYAAEKK